MAEDIWSSEELNASVEAYADMYNKGLRGEKFVKKRIYEDLAERFGRSWKAYEFRMQNISHVVDQLGGEFVAGLKPKQNVGPNAASIIESHIKRLGFLQTKTTIQPPTTIVENPVQLDDRVGGLLGEWELSDAEIAPPSGLTSPIQREGNTTNFARSPEVKAWVIRESGHACECCGHDAPFCKPGGMPYLEVHHVVTLANGGPDTVSNTVAVCPNCHRALHYSADQDSLIDGLYREVERLVRP